MRRCLERGTPTTRLKTKLARLAEADAQNSAFSNDTQFPVSVVRSYGENGR